MRQKKSSSGSGTYPQAQQSPPLRPRLVPPRASPLTKPLLETHSTSIDFFRFSDVDSHVRCVECPDLRTCRILDFRSLQKKKKVKKKKLGYGSHDTVECVVGYCTSEIGSRCPFPSPRPCLSRPDFSYVQHASTWSGKRLQTTIHHPSYARVHARLSLSCPAFSGLYFIVPRLEPQNPAAGASAPAYKNQPC